MKNPIVLKKDLFPVQAFFNAIPERSFTRVLNDFANGIGAGFDDAVCEFASEIEEGEEPYEGVKFYIFDKELIISFESFIDYLSQVCSNYLKLHPSDKVIVEELFERVKLQLRIS